MDYFAFGLLKREIIKFMPKFVYLWAGTYKWASWLAGSKYMVCVPLHEEGFRDIWLFCNTLGLIYSGRIKSLQMSYLSHNKKLTENLYNTLVRTLLFLVINLLLPIL